MPLATVLGVGDLKKRLNEDQALTFTLYGEARGGTIEERIAVGCAIRNRVLEHRKAWGDTYTSVCFAHAQFPCWYPWASQENHDHLLGIVTTFLKGGPVPWSSTERALYTECCWITSGILSGFILDRVQGATHYYAPALIAEGKAPPWTVGAECVTQVGKHLFFKGVR